MADLRPSSDVRPVTEFRANASAVIEQVQRTKRPVILTQHGRSAAVLMDVDVYEQMIDEIALIRDIRVSEQQVAEGRFTDNATVEARLRGRPLP